jgi:hypothetical protein
MKFLIFIVAAAIIAILFLTAPKSKIADPSKIQAAPKLYNPSVGMDPMYSFNQIVKTFPENLDGNPLSVLASGVNTAVSPPVGIVTFKHGYAGSFRGQFVFGWKQDRWNFLTFLNVKTGHDYTEDPHGAEMLTTRPMKDFIEPYMDDGGLKLEALARQNVDRGETIPRR